MKGIIQYDNEGKPICELCGLSFDRIGLHVFYKHNLKMKDYKKQFGLDNIKGICSQKSSLKSREHTLKNFDKCIKKNLLTKWQQTRFKKGSSWRPKEKLSKQSFLRLQKQALNIKH